LILPTNSTLFGWQYLSRIISTGQMPVGYEL
jgi:hypothetical protein